MFVVRSLVVNRDRGVRASLRGASVTVGTPAGVCHIRTTSAPHGRVLGSELLLKVEVRSIGALSLVSLVSTPAPMQSVFEHEMIDRFG